MKRTGAVTTIATEVRNVQNPSYLYFTANIKCHMGYTYTQMFVSGIMSESEITSSFPGRLAELSKTSSASKLKKEKVEIRDESLI